MPSSAGHISSRDKRVRACRHAAIAGLFAIAHLTLSAAAQDSSVASSASYQSTADTTKAWNPKEYVLSLLPPPVSENLDINGWAWLSYLHTTHPSGDFVDSVLSLDITKSFAQRVAISFEGNYVNANGDWRFEIEQLYVSVLALPESETLITVGKFNANFGLERRDFWNGTQGTTGLLFAAQPQDLVGLMVTQPIGDTGIILRPFLSLDFQGQVDFNQSPSAGLQTEYKPNRDLRFSWTNWVGPGFVTFGGQPLLPPFPQGGYGDSEYGDANAIENWQGPNLYAERGGTLYFTDANVLWHPRNDLSLGSEFLLGTTGTSAGRFGWWGVMLAGNFRVTDHLSLFARASFINDSDWLIYGTFQNITEGNVGISYRFTDHLEIRGEYRHDHGSESGDTDSFSIHLAVGI